ncbi:hypothetical protein DL767_001540 [Monosporascus sp. MG133]|nr:hypothetical protein DL767_001540 [Monosporascus sp. MG133]
MCFMSLTALLHYADPTLYLSSVTQVLFIRAQPDDYPALHVCAWAGNQPQRRTLDVRCRNAEAGSRRGRLYGERTALMTMVVIDMHPAAGPARLIAEST